MTTRLDRPPLVLLTGLARTIGYAVFTCLPGLLLTALVVLEWSPLLAVDRAAVEAARDVTRSTPALRDVLVEWAWLSLPSHWYLATVPVLVWVWLRRWRARAVWGLATMLTCWYAATSAKLLVDRPRPSGGDPWALAEGLSYPSGHAWNVAVAWTATLLMTRPLLRRLAWLRGIATGLAVVAVTVTALDRVFLGVHYPSDVVGGVLLGAGLVFASYRGFRLDAYDSGHTGDVAASSWADDRPRTGAS